jgi:hypothetical protein
MPPTLVVEGSVGLDAPGGFTMTDYGYTKGWRRKNPEKWQRQKTRYYRRSRTGSKRKEWTEEALDLITAEDRPSDQALSKRIGRSVEAIQVKRSKIRKHTHAEKTGT